MRDLVAACVDLEALAIELYGVFADSAQDEELRSVFSQMQADEAEHVNWWRDVEARIVAGELPDLDSGTHVTAYMRAIVATLRGMLAADIASFSDEDRLSLAASLEFYALDPVFAQLVAESDPSAGSRRHDAYDEHVALLASAMESRCSWVLAPHIALLRNVVGSQAGGLASDYQDPATGLPLRRVAEQAVDDLCDNPDRNGEPITLALLEITGLQSAYDHDQVLGERTLLRLVSVVTSLLRMTDLLVRPEGNRLAIVMPSTSSASAATTMKAIAQAVAHEGDTTTCIGEALGTVASVVTLPPSEQRCGAHEAFSAAEAQLGQLLATGAALGVLELA